MTTQDIENLLRRMCIAIIDHKEALEIETIDGAITVNIAIRTHGADLPRLVGYGAQNIKALRTIISFIGQRIGKTIRINDLADPVIGRGERAERVQIPVGGRPPEEVVTLITDAALACFPEAKVGQKNLALITRFSIRRTSPMPDRDRLVLNTAFNTLFYSVGKCTGAALDVELL